MRVDYEEVFLRTRYWETIATEIKLRAGYVCQACGRAASDWALLEAHHTTYHHHGCEHEHMDDLQAYCSVCHSLYHGQFLDAVLADAAWDKERQYATLGPLTNLWDDLPEAVERELARLHSDRLSRSSAPAAYGLQEDKMSRAEQMTSRAAQQKRNGSKQTAIATRCTH